jgi:hypothetical protein
MSMTNSPKSGGYANISIFLSKKTKTYRQRILRIKLRMGVRLRRRGRRWSRKKLHLKSMQEFRRHRGRGRHMHRCKMDRKSRHKGCRRMNSSSSQNAL